MPQCARRGHGHGGETQVTGMERVGARGPDRLRKAGAVARAAALQRNDSCFPPFLLRRAALLDAAASPSAFEEPHPKGAHRGQHYDGRRRATASTAPRASAPALVILWTWTARARSALDAHVCHCSVPPERGAPAPLLPLPTPTCRRHVRSDPAFLFTLQSIRLVRCRFAFGGWKWNGMASEGEPEKGGSGGLT
uniref:Uncharacterized protein n=1 Tax=Setaria italica TaxID=4555 RepID=K3XM85_SETIT